MDKAIKSLIEMQNRDGSIYDEEKLPRLPCYDTSLAIMTLELVKEKITVNRDAITGNKLNHNCEVVIFESIGKKLVLFLILICNQKIDNG